LERLRKRRQRSFDYAKHRFKSDTVFLCSRFEEGIGTNPEELVGAAHAGCFSMKLAFNLQAAGFTATELKTDAEIVFEDGSIVASNLTLTAKVEGIEAAKFDELVKDAEANCPISKLLNTKISVQYTLN